MADTKKLFDMASLAEAAYADFNDSNGGVLIAEQVIVNRLKAKDWSETQAKEFAKHYRVVHQQPNTTSGFSATLFERLSDTRAPTGEYVLATRGTETGVQTSVFPLGMDLSADIGDLVADGLAWGQIVDLYNYWKRLTTPAGTYYQKALLVDVTDQSLAAGNYISGARVAEDATTNPLRNKWQIKFTAASDGIGKISAATAVNVTGHSLGGHLSFAFSRLFPGNTSTSYGVNGAGYNAIQPVFAGGANTDYVFRALGGASFFYRDKIQNLHGSAGPDIVAQNAALIQPGAHDKVFIEQGGTVLPLGAVFGHSAVQMTDSMAVYDLFLRLDSKAATQVPSQALSKFLSLFEAGAATKAKSLEQVVQAIAKLVGVSDAAIATDNREALHARIKLIRESDAFKALAYSSTRATGMIDFAATHDAAAAKSDFGSLLALQLGLPFGLKLKNGSDAESTLSSVHNSVYQRWTEDKNLTAAQREAGKAHFSDNWRNDRSALLNWQIVANIKDIDTNAGAIPHNGTPVYFEDKDSGKTFSIGKRPFVGFDTDTVQFGGAEDETFLGASKQDRMYGGGGEDGLYGYGGNDYLEGNAGDDTLAGGAGTDVLVGGQGNDRYEFTAGDAQSGDVIIDADGQGSVWRGTEQLTGGDKLAQNQWQSADKKTLYTFVPDTTGASTGTLTISRSDSADSIYVRGFSRSRSAQRFQSTRHTKAVTHLWRSQTLRNTQKTTHVPCAFPSKSGSRGAWILRDL
jgi:hypothetical protein